MNWSKLSILLVSVVFFILMSGCEEVDSIIDSFSDSSSSASSQMMDMASLFPDVDEQGLIENMPVTTIETTATEGEATFVAKSDSIDIPKNLIYASHPNQQQLTVDASMVSTQDIGKPFFVDGTFKGIIETVNPNGSKRDVVYKNAQYVTEVYDTFDLEFRNSAVKKAAKRSLNSAISSGELKGIYDDINTKPLKFSLKEAPLSQTRSTKSIDDLILRIDIPEGYRIPIQPRGISCTFSDASCDFTTEFNTSRRPSLSTKYEQDYITFDTTGSFMEIGVGAYLKAHYDYNVASDNIFQFTAVQSAYLKSNLSVKVSGNIAYLSASQLKWEKDLKLIGDFKVFIPNPKSEFVQTWLVISPTFTLGLEGKLSGTVSYKHEIERHGEIRESYDSTKKKGSFLSNAVDSGKKTTQNTVAIGIEAEGKFYLYPNLTFVPAITFLSINKPVSLAALQSGIIMENTLAGKIETGFVAENSEKFGSITNKEASLTSTLAGLIRGKWMAKVGEFVFYESDGYTDILKTPENKLFEWKVQLLNPPKLTIKDDATNPAVKNVYFTSDDSKVLGNLYFYYNIGDTVAGTPDVALSGITNHSPVWHIKDQPLLIEGNKIIKARALLLNSDVSDSVWSWGTSVSQQAVLAVSNILKPEITPNAQDFVDQLTITLTQSQGNDIYYKLDNGSMIKYSGPINITGTTTITAYAQSELDGKIVRSDSLVATYIMCDSSQKLQAGMCVDLTCETDNYNCPVCTANETLFYDEYGNGYCAAEDTNSSIKELYTYNDWKLECPEGMTLETNTDTDYNVVRDGCSNDSRDYYSLKDVYYTDATMQTTSIENEFILLDDNSNYHVHHIGYYNSGAKQKESFYAWGMKPNGSYQSLMESETYWYENGNKSSEVFYWQKKNIDLTWSSDTSKTTDYFENGSIREESTYEAKLSDNGRWQSVRTKYTEWNENGIKILENFYESKKNSDGFWYAILKQSISWYDSGIMEEKTDYVSSRDADDNWYPLATNVVNWNENGIKVKEDTYTQDGAIEQIITYYPISGNIATKTINEKRHDPEVGDQYLHTEEWLWYQNGQLSSEKHYEIKQQDNGYWVDFVVSAKDWYENGTKWSESSATLSEDNGRWYIASKIITKWYENGNIFLIDKYTGVYKNGQWSLELTSIEEWDKEGNKVTK